MKTISRSWLTVLKLIQKRSVWLSILILIVAGILSYTTMRYLKVGLDASAGKLKTQTIFSHIKTMGLVYIEPPANQISWLKSNEDLAVFDPRNSQTVVGKAKNSLIYENFSNLEIGTSDFQKLITKSDEQTARLEGAFLHYAKDVKIPLTGRDITTSGTRKQTILENRFEKIYWQTANTGQYLDLTAQVIRSYAQTGTYPLTICQSAGSVLIGSTDKFDQVNFNLKSGYRTLSRVSYSTAPNLDWAETAVQDGTDGLVQSGRMTVEPNPTWIPRSIKGNYLYWLKLDCGAEASQGISLQTEVLSSLKYVWEGTPAIIGKPYQQVGSDYLVPGWDSQNDTDQDGYVSAIEQKQLVNRNATARTAREARVPSYYYRGKFVANMANPLFQQYVSSQINTDLNQTGAQGIFLDNTVITIPDTFKGESSYVELSTGQTYQATLRSYIAALKQNINSKTIFGNTGLTGIADSALQIDGGMIENGVGIGSSYKDTPAMISQFNQIMTAATNQKKYVIVNSNPDARYLTEKAVSKERANLYALSRYYLTSTPNTIFNSQASTAYASPWDDWFGAITYDIGQPLGSWKVDQVFQQPTPPTNLTNYVKSPNFTTSTAFRGQLSADWTCSAIKGSMTCNSALVEGGSALKLTGSPDSQGNRGYGGAYQSLRLEPNTKYTLSALVKTSGLNTSPTGGIRFAANCSPSCAHYSWDGSGTNGWQRVFSILQTDNTGSTTFWAMLSEANGVAYFKDISLVKGEYPYTFLYSRDFSKGTVYLRPEMIRLTTGNEEDTAKTFQLSRTYKGELKNNGSTVITGNLRSLKLKGLEATILIK